MFNIDGMPDRFALAAEINKARKEQGLTKSDIAKHIGISAGHIGDVLNGKRPGSYDLLNKSVVFLGFENITDFIKKSERSKLIKEYCALVEKMNDRELNKVMKSIDKLLPGVNEKWDGVTERRKKDRRVISLDDYKSTK